MKAPQLSRPSQGFWYLVSDGRTAFAMFCSLVFLIPVGAELGRSNSGGGHPLEEFFS